MGEIRSYRDLLVWQKAMDLIEHSYRVTELLPPAERFGLVSSIQRSAVNVASLIANGQGIGVTGQFLHQLTLAHGALMMLETYFHTTVRLKFLDAATVEPLFKETAEVGRMLNGLMRSLRNQQN